MMCCFGIFNGEKNGVIVLVITEPIMWLNFCLIYQFYLEGNISFSSMGKMNLSYVGEIGIIEKPRMLCVQ